MNTLILILVTLIAGMVVGYLIRPALAQILNTEEAKAKEEFAKLKSEYAILKVRAQDFIQKAESKFKRR